MALTLTEGAKLSNDVLQQGVIETVIKDSPILQRLPFIEIVGNGLTYNREKHIAAATARLLRRLQRRRHRGRRARRRSRR